MSHVVLTLDTNVLVSALRSSLGASFRLVQLIGQGEFEIGLTVPLVLEYESVCKRLTDSTDLSSEDIDALIDFLCRVGRKSIVRFRTRPSVVDPDDDMVLEAAVASGSDWLVTHNLRDFTVGAARYGVDVITPSTALNRLELRP